jgi:SNF2 family DNA or RNA helicase
MNFHRQPRAHQLTAYNRFKDKPYFGLWFDPRVGKSKTVLDIWQHYLREERVNTLIVISYPSGVRYVWPEEIRKDLPPQLLAKTKVVVWEAGKSNVGKRRDEVIAAGQYNGPLMVSMNCEALLTDAGEKYIHWLLNHRKVMLVADESSWAANWSARTRKLLALGKHRNVIVKAILDGTPVEESPVEIYFPARFLHEYALGFSSKAAFKARYLITEQKTAYRTGFQYEKVIGYQHLDELRERMEKFGMRVRREDVSDAPPKIFQSQYFELTPKQRKVYDQLRDEYTAELEEGTVTAADVLLRMIRLQMVSRNYWPPQAMGLDCPQCNGTGEVDDLECTACQGIGIVVGHSKLERIDDENPAIDALLEAFRTTVGPVVVWCKFRQDANDVHAALQKADIPALLYTGQISAGDREKRYQEFRLGKTNLVATLGSGLSRGKDLSIARTLCYYSNDFSLRTRRQSEDRAEAIVRNVSTEIIDLVATDTRDQDIIDALRNKRDVAEKVMGDKQF